MRPTGSQLPESLSAALASADDCIFESDLDNFREPAFARYSAGDSLENHVSSALFSTTSQLWRDIGATNPLSPLKPWYAGLAISSVLIMQAGNSIAAGVDRQLLDAAKLAGKNLHFLESSDALQVFDVAPLTEQIAGLEHLVSDPARVIATFNRLQAAWRIGDTVGLAHELEDHLHRLPVTFDGLIHIRNQQWLPRILDSIQSQRRALFVVGALHLVGEYSLQRLLRATPHGHNLVQIRP